MATPFLLAQISDTHLRADADRAADNLKRALADIARVRVDAIIATGDLANDARAEEYARLAGLLAQAPAPLYLLAGNHDDADLIRTAFPAHVYLPRQGRLNYVIDLYPLRLVVLDQTVAGEVHGAFTEELAAWLDAALAAAPGRATIVALHHPPFKTHDRLFDTIGLEGADLFASVIARHAQVVRVIAGHHHRAILGQVAHAPAFVAPSTAWPFSLSFREDEPVARRAPEAPGWALHAWRAGEGLATHVFSI
jgi:3',5'-cyclic AMP phosphodiesterase CpdA